MSNATNMKNGRRELLQSLAATGTVITSTNLVPEKWLKPLIGFASIPAHAASTEPGDPE